MSDDIALQSAQMKVVSMTAGIARDLSDAGSMGLGFRLVQSLDQSATGSAVVLTRTYGSGASREQSISIHDLIALARLAQVSFNPASDEERLKVAASKPGMTRSRADGPDTSRKAGIKAADPKNLSEIQAKVLKALRDAGPAGLTDYEIEERMGDHGSTYRTRRAELAEAGLVVDTGARRTIKGRDRIVWASVRPAGPVQ